MLLCTTTNKAIDSLAEKIHNCGHRNILAFGNASRLCETSLQLTLPYRVAAHLSMCEVQEFKRVSDRTYDLWARIKREAVKESAEEGGAKVDTLLAQGNTVDPGPNYETILKRRIEEKAKELEDRLTGAMRALNQYRVLSEHPDSVADLIQGISLLFIMILQPMRCVNCQQKTAHILHHGCGAGILRESCQQKVVELIA